MIVDCPHCGKKNRLRDNTGVAGTFTCGRCGAPVLTQKASNSRPLLWLQVAAMVAAASIALTCAAVLLSAGANVRDTGGGGAAATTAYRAASAESIAAIKPEIGRASPPPPPVLPFSLPNGSNVGPKRNAVGGGLGSLAISNGAQSDAVVKLLLSPADASAPKVIRAIYVRARSDARIDGVPVGDYTIAYCAGENWDKSARRFTQPVACATFDRIADFREVTTVHDSEIETDYSALSVTLDPRPLGNATTSAIDPAAFDSYQ